MYVECLYNMLHNYVMLSVITLTCERIFSHMCVVVPQHAIRMYAYAQFTVDVST